MNRRYALPLTAALGGAAACVLRLLQNRTGFEADTGLPVPGNPAGLTLTALLAGLGILLCLLTRTLPQEEEPGPAFPEDFAVESPGLLTLPVCGIFLIALSGMADLGDVLGLLPEGLCLSQHGLYSVLRAGGFGFSPVGQILMGGLSLLAAAGLFPAVASCRRKADQPLRNLPAWLLLLPVAALVVRLVLTYRVDSVNPSLEIYYIGLLALVFLTLGFYRLSSFAFQVGQTRRFAFYTGAGVVLSMGALADGGVYLSTLLLYVGGGLTLLGFLLLRIASGIESEQDDGTIIGPVP